MRKCRYWIQWLPTYADKNRQLSNCNKNNRNQKHLSTHRELNFIFLWQEVRAAMKGRDNWCFYQDGVLCSRGWYLGKMETFKIEFTVTILIYLMPITISEDFEVFRPKPNGEDGWIFGRDSFKIPPSLCSQGGMNCAHFNARTKSACHCSCPYGDATFIFDRNDWRCLDNFQTRQLLGN